MMNLTPILLSSMASLCLLTYTFPFTLLPSFFPLLVPKQIVAHKDTLATTKIAQQSVDTTAITSPKPTHAAVPIAYDDTIIIRNALPELYNVLVNDYKGYDNNANQLSILQAPKGKISIKQTDEVDLVIYQANYRSDEPDAFVYQICNDDGVCDSATVHIIKCPAKVPSFPKQEIIILRAEETKEFNYFGKLIYPSPSIKQRPLHGQVTMSADSSLLYYQAEPGFTGLDRLRFTVYEDWDYCGLHVYETVQNHIYVLPNDEQNTKPVAVKDEILLSSAKMVKIKPLENDYDPENTLEKRIVSISMPKKGSARYSSKTVTYMPDRDFKKGVDEMTYRICDYNGACASGKIVIKIEAPRPLTVED